MLVIVIAWAVIVHDPCRDASCCCCCCKYVGAGEIGRKVLVGVVGVVWMVGDAIGDWVAGVWVDELTGVLLRDATIVKAPRNRGIGSEGCWGSIVDAVFSDGKAAAT